MRTLALPVGRGAFTLESAAPLPSEPIVRLPFVLNGRVAGSRASVALEAHALPHAYGRWPHFHNGVAAGLRIARAGTHVTSPWIVFNRPSSELTASHAGTLVSGAGTLPIKSSVFIYRLSSFFSWH